MKGSRWHLKNYKRFEKPYEMDQTWLCGCNFCFEMNVIMCYEIILK